MPSVNWSSSSAYLRSCHEWLDAMERWRSEVLPGWIKRCGDRCATTYTEVIAPITGIKYVAK